MVGVRNKEPSGPRTLSLNTTGNRYVEKTFILYGRTQVLGEIDEHESGILHRKWVGCETVPSITQALIAGALFVLPVYLAILLLLKAAKSLGGVVKPLTRLVPEWFPAENLLSFLLVLVVCLLVGMALRTSLGRVARTRIENSLFQKIPGYGVFRSMTRQMAGDSGENAWTPALDVLPYSFPLSLPRWLAQSIFSPRHECIRSMFRSRKRLR
jgi:hypothetical protein